MEWKIYIRNLVLISICLLGYLFCKNKAELNPVIIQNAWREQPRLSFDSSQSDTELDDTDFDFDEENIDTLIDQEEEEEHQFYELPTKRFTTHEEKLNLFNTLGIDYLKKEIFDYQPAQTIDARQTSMYQEDPTKYEEISFYYKDEVDAQTLVSTSIHWLGQDVGYGIFAEKDITENEFIGMYTGSVQDRSLVDNKDYAWFYPIQTEDEGAVSLDGYSQGNELRFINDGIVPNCQVQYVIGNDDLWHVCYTALTDIKKGEQLLISYGPDYWDSRSYTYQELADEN